MNPSVEEARLVFDLTQNLEHDAVLYRVKFVPKRKMQVPFSIVPDMNFGADPYQWLTVPRMATIGRRIDGVVESFVRITPEFRERDDANPN